MYEQVEKPKENKSRAVSNSVTQKKSGIKQGFGFVDNRAEAIAQMKLENFATVHGKEILQRKIYPPKPTYVTDLQVLEWNNLLEQWNTELSDEEDWIGEREVEMWGDNFDYAATLVALKLKITTEILKDKIQESEADGIGWGEITGVIGQIDGKGTCTVNISINVPYDGSTGTTWYVKGNTTGDDQRGGWKYNAMEDGYLPNARSQVKTALRIHNAEIDVKVGTV